MWFRRLAVPVLATFAFVLPAAPPAVGATASFCVDTAQLQSWIAQDFSPGIDQYATRPNPTLVAGMATYLRKLSDEAPAAVKQDLGVWAAFTQKVADGAGKADLTAGVAPARAAASRVKTWLATKSGCEQLYTESAHAPADDSSHQVVYWVVGAVVVLLLLVLGAAGRGVRGSRTPDAPAPTSGSVGGGFGSPSPQPCGRCNGRRTETCSICGGSGRIDVHDSSRAQFGTSTGVCHRCSGTGSMTCTGCNGSGTRS